MSLERRSNIAFIGLGWRSSRAIGRKLLPRIFLWPRDHWNPGFDETHWGEIGLFFLWPLTRGLVIVDGEKCVLSFIALPCVGILWGRKKVKAEETFEAQKIIRQRAEAGDAEAQNDLGRMYDDGDGVRQDYTEALWWFREAAEQGLDSAQNNLGVMYYRGRGVPKDYTEAAKWFLKAAEQGCANSQNYLGDMYNYPRGVQWDVAKAYMFFNLSAAQGNKDAEVSRNRMELVMNQTQISEGQKLTREWMERKAKEKKK